MHRVTTIGAALLAGVLGWGGCGDGDTSGGPVGSDGPRVDSESAVSSEAGVSETVAETMRSRAAEAVGGVGAPGVSVAVDVPGQGRWLWTHGVASRQEGSPLYGQPMEPEHHLRIGSITKSMVVAVILQLVAEDRIALDDDVAPILPELGLWAGVTPERLMRHTSGLFNYTDDAVFVTRSRTDIAPEDLVREQVDRGPVFAPGENQLYSNTGYFVLGLLIRALDGRPLAVSMRDRLFRPTGMDALWLETEEAARGTLVDGHLLGGDADPLFSTTWSWAAGAGVGTAAALCDWARELVGGEILPADLRDELLAPTVLADGMQPENDEGMGWRWREVAGRRVVGHTGSTMGFRGELFHDPSDGACVAVLTNDFLSRPRGLADALWEALSE